METRGKGVSTTKFCKDGTPKHAGNFSPTTIHYQSLVSKDYPVKRMLLDDGTETLVIIGKTETRPLAEFMPQSVIDYVLSDFTSEEKEMIPDLCKKVADGIRTFATAGPQMAMNLLNIRKK